jgi:glucose/arabinose dehydrogenase
MHTLGLILLAGVLLVGGCRARGPATSGTAPGPLTVERVASGLHEPVALVWPSPTRALIAERTTGALRWLVRGKVLPELCGRVPVGADVAAGGGLLGLAVDPEYPRQPYLYVSVSVPAGARPGRVRLLRLTLRGDRIHAQVPVGEWPAGDTAPGGSLTFGPEDGMLYLALGDATVSRAQDYEAPSGKILRLHPDGQVPTDNPFETLQTLWAEDDRAGERPLEKQHLPAYTVGLRAPVALAFHPESHAFYVSDQGPGRDDELNRMVAGDNYGWPTVTGAAVDPYYRPPIWSSGAHGGTLIGLTVYTGRALPAFHGNLFFTAADGHLRRVILRDPDHIARVEIVAVAGRRATRVVATGADGFLYFTNHEALFRLRAGEE